MRSVRGPPRVRPGRVPRRRGPSSGLSGRRLGRRLARGRLVERGEDRGGLLGREAAARRRAAGSPRADRRPSAPPPEGARPGVLEDLELVGRGLDVEVAALQRPEDLEPGGLAAIAGAGRAERRDGLSGRRRRRSGAGGRTRLGAAVASATTTIAPASVARAGGPAASGPPGPAAWAPRAGPARPASRPARRPPAHAAAGCRPRSCGPRRRSCPAPKTSVRRPRPPSDEWGPVARTSPAIDAVSTRTWLGVVSSTSPLTELITCSRPAPSAAVIRTSPLVVDASRASNRGARRVRSPETDRAERRRPPSPRARRRPTSIRG